MKESLATRFKAEYARLREKRSGVDHELAKLAFDIRAQFKDGEAGRSEAVSWCSTELGRTSQQARAFLDDGDAWTCVRQLDHWVAIGGLGSARILAALAPKQRMVVLAEALAKADKRKRPLSRSHVRDIAWRHGFVEKEPPKVTEAKKAAALTAFVNRLYATVKGLPPLPADIRAIVAPKRPHRRAA